MNNEFKIKSGKITWADFISTSNILWTQNANIILPWTKNRQLFASLAHHIHLKTVFFFIASHIAFTYVKKGHRCVFYCLKQPNQIEWTRFANKYVAAINKRKRYILFPPVHERKILFLTHASTPKKILSFWEWKPFFLLFYIYKIYGLNGCACVHINHFRMIEMVQLTKYPLVYVQM